MVIQKEILNIAINVLIDFMLIAAKESFETVRLARAGWALLAAGCKPTLPFFSATANQLLVKQSPDGGWSDPEDTAWAVGVLSFMERPDNPEVQTAVRWLDIVRSRESGWGRHPRDKSRIPITALISTLVPQVIISEDIDWLLGEWQKDFNVSVRLSYKAGFFLLAMAGKQKCKLVTQTISHLVGDQNEDGGFGPWKNHPIGSDPWSTGVVLWGLSKWVKEVDESVFIKALNWLRDTQLPSGYWPYHYLDEGTSYALIGMVSAMKTLSIKK